MDARSHGRQKGYSLVEIIITMVLFAVGMVAFAQLQGNLTRTSLDAKLRTMAANVGEEVIETQRRFTRLATDPDGVLFAYDDIATGTRSLSRGGVGFTIDQTVTDYYWDSANAQFTSTPPAGTVHSDFKRVDVSVSWDNPLEFNLQAGVTSSGNLGSGGIAVTGIISSAVTATKRLALIDDLNGEGYQPPVEYTPGDLPDVVTVSMGNGMYRETSTPVPDVTRTNELVETRFDVVTYSSDGTDTLYRRRDEIRVVSCECTLRAAPLDADDGGRRPTLWTGLEYALGEMVAKPYGESANNQQSGLCTICCRDHHDGGTGAGDDPYDPGRSLYNPFRAADDYHDGGAFDGDHKHYGRDPQGQLVLAASDGDAYLEACRLVRKDGFFRVAQDLRQETLLALPEDYLDQSSEEVEYSQYVTTAVEDLASVLTDGYEASPPALPGPGEVLPPLVLPASSSANATTLPTALGDTTQQLRSRGVYLDYLADELRTRYDCMAAGGSAAACDAGDAKAALEILPFFDVQLTWLTRWTETPVNYPVEVSNQAVASDNAHSRGLAEQAGIGFSVVNATGHTGNLGLTDTDPLDTRYVADLRNAPLHIEALSGSAPPPTGSIVVNGDILSAVNGVQASGVDIEADEAQCNRTNTGYTCIVDASAVNPRLTVSGYGKRNRILLACSDGLVTQVVNTGANPYTVFDLPTLGTSPVTADIVIKEDSCT